MSFLLLKEQADSQAGAIQRNIHREKDSQEKAGAEAEARSAWEPGG